jgi:hypothetical protein
MEPHFDGPFKISGRNIDSGNYLLQTQEGENLKSSYPRDGNSSQQQTLPN